MTDISRILIVGDDKICRTYLRDNPPPPDVKILIDRGTDPKRVFRLIRSGAISIGLILRMLLADLGRADGPPICGGIEVRSSADILSIVNEIRPSNILLFRVGIIVRKELIAAGYPIWNIHAAKIPEFGGLGSIWRALKATAFSQYATLYVVTEGIDSGEVLAVEPYALDPKASYGDNENVAYAAGCRLLSRALSAQ
jgi:Formyl transferase